NRQLGTDSSDSYVTAAKYNAPSSFAMYDSGGGVVSSAGAIPDATWQYLTAVHNGSDLRLYSNGVLVGSTTGMGAITTDDNDVIIGGGENDATSTITEFFKGLLDEIRISDVARSADWIAAQHASMSDSFVSFGSEELAPAIGGVMTNDTDPQGDALTAILISGPSNAASFTFNADGTFSYTPTLNFGGTDSFTYKVNDGSTDSNVATVAITVEDVAVNFTIDSTISISEDLAEQSTFSVVLGGDALAGGNTASVDIVASGSAQSGTDYDNFITAIANAAGTTAGVTFDAVDTLTFDSSFNGGAGQGAFTFTVNAIDDIALEGTETIIATLSNATVTYGTATFGTVRDAFTEVSDTPITAHLPNTGLGWTEVYDSSTAGTDATINGSLDVLNGGSDENSVGQAYTAGPAPTSVDQTISFTLSSIDTTTGTKPVGVFGRYVDNDNFYYLQVLTNGNAQDSLQLAKMEGGVTTILGTVDVTIAPGDTFKLEITDATKKIYHNGIQVISSTDNSLTAVGNWGLYFGDFNGIGGHLRSTWGIDNFLAEDSASTATATTLITETDVNDAPHAADDRHGVDFDGIEDHILIGTDAALEMSATMTIEAWINPDGSTNLNTMIVNREGEYEVALAADNTIQWAFANTDPSWGWHNTGVAVELGEWSHIAVTYDNGDVTTYLNGIQIDFYDGSGTIGDSHATLDEFRIGGRQNNPLNQSFDGRISDVRIWDLARTGVVIAADMNTTLTGSESNLVGYWKLDENSYTATDSAGTNDGTLAVNAAPTGYWVSEDSTITEAAPGVLGNDFDADGDPLTISEVEGNAANVGSQITLASGALLTLNANGSFDYDTNGAFESLGSGATTEDKFTYTATDGIATDTATVTIQIIGVNDTPVFDSTPVTAATEDSAYSYAIATSDVDGDPLAITASTLPAWLTLTDNGDGTASLTGTPTNAEVGSHSVVLEVTDGTVITTQSFSILVANTNDAPTFDSTAVTAATEDSAYSYAIATSDVDGEPLV
ncbi:MAG: tandem-95 repeat protein, partial [Rhodothermales bacterium]|nr:tandem-95 repeat protein [Rhodothermales bacterium]